LNDEGVQEGRGRWGAEEAASHGTFRRSSTGGDPLGVLPDDVVSQIGREGSGALAVAGERGPTVLPIRWRAEANTLYAALPAQTLAIAAADPDATVALTVDSPSAWRARDMVGAMFQGVAESFVEGSVGSGAKTMRAILQDLAPSADALVRITPRRVVWWKGWTSGSTNAG
jgi:hypothetical protein